MQVRYHTRILQIVALLALIAAPVFAQPKIAIVGPESIDWGYVTPGLVQHPIKVVNLGKDTLILSGLATGLASVVPFDAYPLGPKDTLTFIVQMQTLRVIGERKGWVKIGSNDPVRPNLEIPLRAFALRQMYVEPDGAIGFFKMSVGAESRQDVVISNMSPDKVTINKVLQTSCCECEGKLRVTLPEPLVIPAGGKVTLPVYFNTDKPGHGECELEFHAAEENVPATKVRVMYSAQ